MTNNHNTRTTHGHASTGHPSPEYVVWIHMIQRCEDRNHTHYARYGGRGIIVCPRWRTSFPNFLADMGPRPSMKHTLDRWPNKNGNYEPGNARWATWIEQANNRNPPTCTQLTWNGETRTIREWTQITGLSRQTINWRLTHNWPIEQVLASVLPHRQRPGNGKR